jgi:amidase
LATFILRLDPAPGDGVRLAVKDIIDMVGLPTTAGSRVVAESAGPAGTDAACLKGARAAGARIVGKTNLHELAAGPIGLNPWFGDPVNPLDPARIPGGSSSGSAVAVATGEADVAYGSDTGGSIRVPSACCGTTGLKTTYGRVPLDGVWPFAAGLDTVGPMARDVAGVARGMALLEPGFAPAAAPAGVVGRFRLAADPVLDAAVDAALAAAGFEVLPVALPGWMPMLGQGLPLLLSQLRQADNHLPRERIAPDVAAMLEMSDATTPAEVAAAHAAVRAWQAELAGVFERVQLIALPTMTTFAPTPAAADVVQLITGTFPVNLAGLPALAQPVPAAGPLPASLQLIGPAGSEELLLATGAVVEAATH